MNLHASFSLSRIFNYFGKNSRIHHEVGSAAPSHLCWHDNDMRPPFFWMDSAYDTLGALFFFINNNNNNNKNRILKLRAPAD